MGVSQKTIRDALQYVANHPEPSAVPLDMPVWEHVGRALFELANNPDPRVRGGLAKATRAQQMLLDRMVGKRRAGSRPLNGQVNAVTFHDLTAGLIQEAPDEQ